MRLEIEKIRENQILSVWAYPGEGLMFHILLIRNGCVYDTSISKDTTNSEWICPDISFCHSEAYFMLRQIEHEDINKFSRREINRNFNRKYEKEMLEYLNR